MFKLLADNNIKNGQPLTDQGSYVDALACILDAEEYDYAEITCRGEVVASWWVTTGWWLGCFEDECRADRHRVWQEMIGLHDCYGNSL